MFWIIFLSILAWGLYMWHRSSQRYAETVPDMHKKCVFITGCDSGFGQAIAIRLDSKGVPVFAGCLTDKGAESLKEKCSNRLQTIILDVTKTETIQKAYEFVLANLPEGCEFWGVLNNAGIFGLDGPTEFHTRDDYRRLLEVNFLGMTDVNTIFLPLLKKSLGRIVNMASITGFAAMPRLAPYCASKHAVLAYSDALRMEKSVWGVHVAVVAPAGFQTQLTVEAQFVKDKARQWDRLPTSVQEEYGKDIFQASVDWHIGWHTTKADTDLSPVINAYEHGLFGKYPKAHYIPDSQGRQMYFIHNLPYSVCDKIMQMIFVTNKKLFLPKILQTRNTSMSLVSIYDRLFFGRNTLEDSAKN